MLKVPYKLCGSGARISTSSAKAQYPSACLDGSNGGYIISGSTGRGGIRTHGTVTRTPDFQSGLAPGVSASP